MIGLRKGTVTVVYHNPEWNRLFEQERRLLWKTIGNIVVDIQHVGSTAVVGLQAKPILDIAVAVTSQRVVPACVPPLLRIGYIDRGDKGRDGGHLFVKESAPEVRTHHLHLVPVDDPQWRDYMRFRDILRADEELRASYSALKSGLQKRFPLDRESYTAAKKEFIRDVLRRRVSIGDGS